MKFLTSLCITLVGVCCISCYHEQQIPVAIDFQYEMPETFTVPVEIKLTNNTTGAYFYRWTFAGTSPSSSDKKELTVLFHRSVSSHVLTDRNGLIKRSEDIISEGRDGILMGSSRLTVSVVHMNGFR